MTDPVTLAEQTLAGSTNDWVGRAQQLALHVVAMDRDHRRYVEETSALIDRMETEVACAQSRLDAALAETRTHAVRAAEAAADLRAENELRLRAETVGRDVLSRLVAVDEGAFRVLPGASRIIERHRKVIGDA